MAHFCPKTNKNIDTWNMSEKINARNGIRITIILMDKILWCGLKNESVKQCLFMKSRIWMPERHLRYSDQQACLWVLYWILIFLSPLLSRIIWKTWTYLQCYCWNLQKQFWLWLMDIFLITLSFSFQDYLALCESSDLRYKNLYQLVVLLTSKWLNQALKDRVFLMWYPLNIRY